MADNVYFVATQFATLDCSNDQILLFWLAEEFDRTKVTRRTSDVYELFIHVDTSNAYKLLLFYVVYTNVSQICLLVCFDDTDSTFCSTANKMFCDSFANVSHKLSDLRQSLCKTRTRLICDPKQEFRCQWSYLMNDKSEKIP